MLLDYFIIKECFLLFAISEDFRGLPTTVFWFRMNKHFDYSLYHQISIYFWLQSISRIKCVLFGSYIPSLDLLQSESPVKRYKSGILFIYAFYKCLLNPLVNISSVGSLESKSKTKESWETILWFWLFQNSANQNGVRLYPAASHILHSVFHLVRSSISIKWSWTKRWKHV